MERLVLPDFLLKKHPLRIRKSLDDALFGPYRTLCNETRLLAVGSHKFQLYLDYLYQILGIFILSR